MIQNICSYTPFCNFSVEILLEYPKTTIVTMLFLTYIALCVYDTYSKGIKVRVSIGDHPQTEREKVTHVTTFSLHNGWPRIRKSVI